MKSMLVIGLGEFGSQLCRQLVRMENEVLAIDADEDAVDNIKDIVSSCLIADCTSKGVLERLGVNNFDVCFVCIGSNFKSNVIVVNYLKELGAKYIVSEIDDAILGKIITNIGADEVIHPKKDSATRAAVRFTDEHIFDYIELKGGYSIYEITPLQEWVGHSILDSNIRAKYDISIIGVYRNTGKVIMVPDPNTVIYASDKITVLAHESTMEDLLRKM